MTIANPKLQDDILCGISRAKAHVKTGNQDGEESVSFITQSLRDKGWKRLGNGSDFEDLVEGLGFTIREIHIGNDTRRSFITL